jgi:hypothetical protein
MPVLAACPCESTQFALPVWKVEYSAKSGGGIYCYTLGNQATQNARQHIAHTTCGHTRVAIGYDTYRGSSRGNQTTCALENNASLVARLNGSNRRKTVSLNFSRGYSQ